MRLAVWWLVSLLGVIAAAKENEEGQRRGEVARGAAVWGVPAPDYSGLELPAETTIISTILFVDKRITSHYHDDMSVVKREVLKLVVEANEYLNQLRLGVIVVDVARTHRDNMTLHMFREWRTRSLPSLPLHDVGVLLSFGYSGGLAFVGGMCNRQAVMLCGFYPQEPSALGSIFFHEMAHLLGVEHSDNATAHVENCLCEGRGRRVREEKAGRGGEACMHIPGFDHDCTAQDLANRIDRYRCLRRSPAPLLNATLAICGNGVVEWGEECDCGLSRLCSEWNCLPDKCQQRIHPIVGWLVVIGSLVCVCVVCIYHARKTMFSCFKDSSRASREWRRVESGGGGGGGGRREARSLLPPRMLHKTTSEMVGLCSSGQLLVLERPPRAARASSQPREAREGDRRELIRRPTMPPPPPPPSNQQVQPVRPRGSLAVVPSPDFVTPSRREQRRSEIADSLSWKFDDFEDDDDDDVAYYKGENGVPTCPIYPGSSPINRVTVKYHGSDQTLVTDCPSSSTSHSSVSQIAK